MLGSRPLGLLLAFAGLAGLLSLEYLGLFVTPPIDWVIPTLTPDSTPEEVGQLMNAQFGSLPPWVRLWLYFWHYLMAGALLFGLWHKEAQLYTLAWLGNHLILFATMPFMPPEIMSFKYASLTLWLFIPVAVIMIKNWRTSNWPDAYRVWAGLATAQIFVAMIFDVPDGIEFLWAWLTI